MNKNYFDNPLPYKSFGDPLPTQTIECAKAARVGTYTTDAGKPSTPEEREKRRNKIEAGRKDREEAERKEIEKEKEKAREGIELFDKNARDGLHEKLAEEWGGDYLDEDGYNYDVDFKNLSEEGKEQFFLEFLEKISTGTKDSLPLAVKFKREGYVPGSRSSSSHIKHFSKEDVGRAEKYTEKLFESIWKKYVK